MHQTAKDESVPAQDSRKVLTTVFISLLIDLLGFTVILPLFPSLLEFYQKNDKGTLYSRMESVVSTFRSCVAVPEAENINSVLFGGMIGSLFSLLQFINAPLFGAASDKYGRRAMIITSLAGSAISYLLWIASDNFALFLVARVIAGVSEANVSISTAVIADLPTAKERSRGMAFIGVAFSVGFVFGPLVGALFAKVFEDQSRFYMGPALFSFAITCVDILYVYRNLPETLPPNKRASSVASSFADLCHLLNPLALFCFSAVNSIRNTKKASSLRRIGVVYFLYLFLFSGLEFTLTFLAHRRFSFTRMEQGKMFAVLGLIMALVQGGYIRRKMAGKEKRLAVMGISLLIPGFVVIGMSTSSGMLYAGLVLFAFAAASVVPCLSAMTSAHGLESEKGRVMGILRSLGALARATGPVCASAVYWLLGPTVTYTCGAVLLAIPLFLLNGWKSPLDTVAKKSE